MAKIRFDPDGIEVEVPVGTTILEAAEHAGAQVGSVCGGVCACSSCHVYIKEGGEDLSPIEMGEEDGLDKAFDVHANSRLGCQSEVLKDRLYVIEITRESRQSYFDEHPEAREKS